MNGRSPLTFIKKSWLPLLIVVVVVIAGMVVYRTRTFFGADGITVTPRNFADDPEPFDPKVVKYEIFGTGTYADVNYLDLDANRSAQTVRRCRGH